MAMDVRCYREKTKNDEWVIDSGSTRHMTYCMEGLVNYHSISTAVRVGGDFELHAMGVGDKEVTLKTYSVCFILRKLVNAVVDRSSYDLCVLFEPVTNQGPRRAVSL